MKLQVTKAQNVDQMGSALKNERGSDPCNLRIQSYIYGAEKKKDNIHLKQNAAKELGYKYEIWVFNKKKELLEVKL